MTAVGRPVRLYDAMYEISPFGWISTTRNHEDQAYGRSPGEPEPRSQAENAGSIPVVRSRWSFLAAPRCAQTHRRFEVEAGVQHPSGGDVDYWTAEVSRIRLSTTPWAKLRSAHCSAESSRDRLR